MEPEETFDEIRDGAPADAGAPVRRVVHTTHHDDDRPAQERIAELFERMQPHRRILQTILKMCEAAPCPYEELVSRIEELSVHNRSVYSPEGFCDLLERSGALAKTTSEGEPFPEEEPEPRVVVEDGVEYLEPAEMPELHYLATDEGRRALDAGRSLAKIEQLLEKETAFLPVYKQVLQMCAAEEGASMPALDAAIVNHPLVQSPRYYANRFVSFLESVDAVYWQSGWHLSEGGLEALEMLKDIDAAGM